MSRESYSAGERISAEGRLRRAREDDCSALALSVCSALGERGGEARSAGDLIAVAVSSPPSPILCWGNRTQIKYYFLCIEQYEANNIHHTPLAWLPVRKHSYAFPGTHEGGFSGFNKKMQQLTMLLHPYSGSYKKNNNQRPSVHVQLNSTCTDDRQFYD